MKHKRIASPLGQLTLLASERGLAALLWENDRPGRVPVQAGDLCDDHPILLQAEQQLGEYFAGQRRTFSVALDIAGTDFQREVWRALLAIPFGATRNYQELAHHIGRPTAARAVGAANGRNPVSIIIPCHRLIGLDGALTGFAGGLAAKAYLLDLERRSRLLERQEQGAQLAGVVLQ